MARALILLGFLLAASGLQAQEASSLRQQVDALPWQRAPAALELPGVGTIALSGELQFLDAGNVPRLRELFGLGAAAGRRLSAIAPGSRQWLAFLEYDPIRYVPDDTALDADAILQALRAETPPSRGPPEWAMPPRYDREAKLLEWATRSTSSTGEPFALYDFRALGSQGVLMVRVLLPPELLGEALEELRPALRSFAFRQGLRYADHRQGDLRAELGLSGLIDGRRPVSQVRTVQFDGTATALFAGGVMLLFLVGRLARNHYVRKYQREDGGPE